VVTWSVKLGEKHWPRVIENNAVNKVFWAWDVGSNWSMAKISWRWASWYLLLAEYYLEWSNHAGRDGIERACARYRV